MSTYLELLKKIGSKIRNSVLDLMKENSLLSIAEKLSLNPSDQFTRRIDKVAEDMAVNLISESGITTYLISEELGEKIIGEGEPEIFMVLDPVDGTRNAISGIPFFCVSIALGKYKPEIFIDDITAGYVIDICNGTSFWAEKGSGAFEDGRQIKTSSKKTLTDCLVSIYAYKYPQSLKSYKEIAANAKVRTLGSQALEICYTASARFDAAMDFRGISRVVDTAAAKIILEEAGGIFYILDKTIDEKNLSLKNAKRFSFIAAPNKELLDNLLQLYRS
ncbi:MAG: inositol monophosphatase family protein [Candidatus Odinarchaeia archaeon]